MPDYVLEGFKYGSSVAGSGGGLLTWAFDTTVPSSFAPVLKEAFDDWASKANIQFQQSASFASATIKITASYIDGVNNVLGTGGSSFMNAPSGLNLGTSGFVNFDSGENWHASGDKIISDGGVSLFNVAIHEIGHVIGLDHYNSSPAIMNAIIDPSLTDLTQSDIDGIQHLYGSPAVTPASSAAQPSGSASEIASFSNSGYLAANPDVAKSGMDALTHYQQYGWKEGRDPTATFDVEQYLQHNPDVKAAGMDPFQHYLTYGQFEGRQAYDAIGKASSFTHGSFDAEYYLLANADVAKAAIGAGGDSFAFAYNHFVNFGSHEGRKADAYFDTAYYLAHNPDVAAAHVDPLAHYDNFGWKEGRNASVDFNTAAYLAANPDVAAAHIDPLTHYLQFGVHEGRHLA